jgi:hypothetical protein
MKTTARDSQKFSFAVNYFPHTSIAKSETKKIIKLETVLRANFYLSPFNKTLKKLKKT